MNESYRDNKLYEALGKSDSTQHFQSVFDPFLVAQIAEDTAHLGTEEPVMETLQWAASGLEVNSHF